MMTANELLFMLGQTHKNGDDEAFYWRAFTSADNTYPIFIREVLWVNDDFLIRTDEYKWGWSGGFMTGQYRGDNHFPRRLVYVSNRYWNLTSICGSHKIKCGY